MEDRDFLAKMSPDTFCYLDNVRDLYNAPYARANNIEIESITADEVRLSMVIEDKHMNGLGFCHGGASYGLTDHTFAFASNLRCCALGQCTNIIYHRSVKKGKLESVSKLINESKSISVYDIKVYCEGKLISTATCTAFKIRKE